jgi:Domain of unknown function (DUF4832)
MEVSGRIILPPMTRRKITFLMIISFAMASASVLRAQEWRSMTFRADAPGIDQNPLRGLVPYTSMERSPDSFPHSMEWFYMPLSDVLKGPNVYDWTPLERQLTAVAGRQHQAIFRFYLDFPRKPSGIPRYLLDSGLKTFPYDDEGNATGPTPSVAPDYRDPRLIDCLVRFIHALGAKYDGDVRIAWVEAGLYGFWGEWHVLNHPLPGEPAGWQIAQKDKDILLQAYAESFLRTGVLVRYPKVTHNRRLLAHFGFHDDSFLQDTLGPEDWQFWPSMEQSGTTETWRTRPMGGEIRPELQAEIWDQWPNAEGQDVATAIATTHATWMLDADLFSTSPTAEERTNAMRAARLMGYMLYCAAVRMVPGQNESTEITVRIENRGVAPFYYMWPAELQALDSHRKVIAQAGAVWPLPSLLPGKKVEWSALLHAPPGGIRSVLLRIANPMQGGYPVSFANAEMGTVRDGWLTLDVRR